MSDIADMVYSGAICSQCQDWLGGDEPGHPRVCADCWSEMTPKERNGHMLFATGEESNPHAREVEGG